MIYAVILASKANIQMQTTGTCMEMSPKNRAEGKQERDLRCALRDHLDVDSFGSKNMKCLPSHTSNKVRPHED